MSFDGSAPAARQYRRGNRLLDALPEVDRVALFNKIEVVELLPSQVVQAPHAAIDYVYFPISCVISVVASLMDGGQCEVGFVGNEGASGVEGAFGADVLRESICYIPGHAARLGVRDFLHHVQNHGALDALIRSTEKARTFVLEQMIVCNSLHGLRQRLARWLLLLADRTDRTEFPLTQEFLSSILGVRRASVTGAALVLQRRGLITYRRGRVIVPERKALELEAYDCYREVTNAFDHALRVLQRQNAGFEPNSAQLRA